MLRYTLTVLSVMLLSLTLLTGCVEVPTGGEETSASQVGHVDQADQADDNVNPVIAPASLKLEAIDDESFNSLSEEDRLYVARKLYSTIYKGVEYKKLKEQVDTKKFISDFATILNADVKQPDPTEMETYIPYDPSLEAHNAIADSTEKYAGNIKQEIYSKLNYTKLGREYFNKWIAYVLTQTILFSPAREVDSVAPFPEFIRNVYYRLANGLDEGKTIKEIVYEHMISVENWGRFRSPEDNGREMLEIWLRNFQDEPVPIAAKALQNWRFENHYDSSIGWQVYDFYRDEPGVDLNESVELFGFTLRNGYDFFKMVTEHPDFMPTVVSRIVDYFFPTMSEAERADIVEKVLEDKPETFQQIFAQILFSKKYLFESDKVKSVEEVFYPMVQALPYHLTKYSWSNAWAPSIKGLSAAMERSNQKSMWNKLGRDNDLPTDTLSINYFHQYVRDGILLAQCDNPESKSQEGIVFSWLDERLDDTTMESYIDGIFLEVLGRHAKEAEKTKLVELAKIAGWDDKFYRSWYRFQLSKLVRDYISRLSEVYRYRRIEGAAE